MRAFLAILLDPPLRDALRACVRALQAAHPPARLKWVGDEQHHLTLHFLGEISAAQNEAVTRALAALPPPPAAPLSLTLGGLGAFPNLSRPVTLWAGGEDAGGGIATRTAEYGRALRTLGFEIDSRPFTPHLTLARVPRDLDPASIRAVGAWFAARKALAPPPLAQAVRAVHLMRSELLPSGARYTPVAEFSLGADSPRG
jgi:2'-5' RNA ligase